MKVKGLKRFVKSLQEKDGAQFVVLGSHIKSENLKEAMLHIHACVASGTHLTFSCVGDKSAKLEFIELPKEKRRKKKKRRRK